MKHARLLKVLRNNNKGFSLLELVVAVGILLVLTVGGLLAYNGVTDNARQAAVNNAAETVYNKAMIYKTDNDSSTTVYKAADEWNESVGIELPDNIATVNIVSGIGVNESKIIVYADELDSDSFEIKAIYGDNEFEAVKSSPGVHEKSNDSESSPKEDEDSAPLEKDTITKLIYNCDKTYSTSLPFAKVSSDFSVEISGDDGSNVVLGSSEIKTKRQFTGDVTYTVVADGTYDQLSVAAPGSALSSFCLTSIEKIGNDTEITKINNIGGEKWTNVPNTIPSSINDLSNMFNGAYNMNDADISSWNTKNVNNMFQMFYNATLFNQPLNNWDVSGVTQMNNMFYSAINFNQPLNTWDVSNVTDMTNMFNNAMSFNQPLDSWNVGSVIKMLQMFSRSSAFNQDISKWNVSNVTNMDLMFYNASSFDQNLSGWSVSQVTNHKSFNNGTKMIKTSSYTPEWVS